MALVFVSQGKGKPVLVQDLLAQNGPYRVGRWCKAPEKPDRCYWCPLIDIKPATGFVADHQGWRLGHCAKHRAQARKDYPKGERGEI